MKYQIRGRYFEDWQVGDEYITMARTDTLTDTEMYCNQVGDGNPMHDERRKPHQGGDYRMEGSCLKT